MASLEREPSSLTERVRAAYAARDYAGVRDLLAAQREEPLLREPELAFWLADSLRRLGEAERALELALRLEPVCRGRGNDRLTRDRSNLEGMLRFELGDPATAAAAWQTLAELAAAAGDAEYLARSSQNLGVVETLAGEAERALASYWRAIAAYRRLGYRRGLAQCHHNLGILYRELEHAAESERHFERAAGYAEEADSDDELARIAHERALLVLDRGDARLAETLAARSRRRFAELSDPAGEGEALRVLGIVALATGRVDEATTRLEEALDRARRTRRRLLEAEVLEALAALAVAAGRADEADAHRAEAETAFTAMRAAGWGARVRRRMEAAAARAAARPS